MTPLPVAPLGVMDFPCYVVYGNERAGALRLPIGSLAGRRPNACGAGPALRLASGCRARDQPFGFCVPRHRRLPVVLRFAPAGRRWHRARVGPDTPPELGHSFRLGTYFLIDLQNVTNGNPYLIPAGTQFFHALFGFSASWSVDAWSRRWLGPGSALELSLVAGHESDHATRDLPSDFVESPNVGDIVGHTDGNFFAPDLAARFPLGGRFLLTVRPQWRIYLLGSGPFRDAPALDVVLRWLAGPHVQPLLSTRAEYWFVDHAGNGALNGGFARALLGVAFPGGVGEITPFGAIDAGNGNGLLVNERETRFTLGVRYAAF